MLAVRPSLRSLIFTTFNTLLSKNCTVSNFANFRSKLLSLILEHDIRPENWLLYKISHMFRVIDIIPESWAVLAILSVVKGHVCNSISPQQVERLLGEKVCNGFVI